MDNALIDEANLLARLKKGDELAFAALYQLYAADLLAYTASRMFRMEDIFVTSPLMQRYKAFVFASLNFLW